MKRASNGAWYYEKKIDGKTGTVPRSLWPSQGPPVEMFTYQQVLDESQASYAKGFNDARPRPMTENEIVIFILLCIFLATAFNILFENWDRIVALAGSPM